MLAARPSPSMRIRHVEVAEAPTRLATVYVYDSTKLASRTAEAPHSACSGVDIQVNDSVGNFADPTVGTENRFPEIYVARDLREKPHLVLIP